MEDPLHPDRLSFPAPLPPDLRLIETFGWDGRTFPRLDRHLARLARSAARLGLPQEAGAVARALAPLGGPDPLRIRLTLDRTGRVEVTAAPLGPPPRHWHLALAAERLEAKDPWLGVKTTMRHRYDRARAALPAGVDELIFANAADRLCEGTITTLFFDLGQGLQTPPLAEGCLPGCLREELLETGRCSETPLPLARLPEADLWMGNSLRGLIPATLLP